MSIQLPRISYLNLDHYQSHRYFNTCTPTLLSHAFTITSVMLADNIDYPGFLLIALNCGDKHDLQVIQDDALRFCLKLLDMISIPQLHNSVQLLSLEQSRQKQLLKIMFIQAQKGKSRMITNVNTRNQRNYNR